MACLIFENGALASLFVNEATYPLVSDSRLAEMPGRSGLEVHGTLGSLVYTTWEELRFSSPRHSFRMRREGSDDMGREQREFLDAILEDRDPSVGGDEGRQGIAVIQALYESERRNAPVQVSEMLSQR